MLCNRCGQKKSRYSVARPTGGYLKLCITCFTQGLNKGTIVMGNKKRAVVA